LNTELDKTFQVADWRIRPLPKGMMDYARNDSHYLIPVYMMILELAESNFACAPQLQGRQMSQEFMQQEWLIKVQ